MAAATGLPQVSSFLSALWNCITPLNRAAMASCSLILPPEEEALPSISSSAAPAQKPFSLPEVMTTPLMVSSPETFSATCAISAMAELVSTFIERPGTSHVRVTMPSAS